MYALGKSVDVQLRDHGKPYDGKVGVGQDGTIFGLVAEFYGELSYMSYRLDEYFVPSDVVATTRAKSGLFYFDVGNELTIDVDELERAFRELGLL